MSTLQLGRSYKIDAPAAHSATVIFLHGLGDTGKQWSLSLEKLGLGHVKFICPTAPPQPVTLNGGFSMPSWFDIRGLDPKSEEDAAGIESAANAVKSLVEAEIAAGVPADRIVIGGFSQGGAAAIYSALTMEKDIGAVVLLSTWLPLHQRFPGAAKANLTTPILQCHGKADPIVPFQWGKLTSVALAALNDKHRFREYASMAHHSSDAEMRDLKTFLNEVVPPK